MGKKLCELFRARYNYWSACTVGPGILSLSGIKDTMARASERRVKMMMNSGTLKTKNVRMIFCRFERMDLFTVVCAFLKQVWSWCSILAGFVCINEMLFLCTGKCLLHVCCQVPLSVKLLVLFCQPTQQTF